MRKWPIRATALTAVCLGACAFPAVGTASTGGASPGTTKPTTSKPKPKPTSGARVLKHVLITEYFPAPEKWFKGKKIAADGITGKHRIDWLYSARGLPMEGDGVDLSGRHWHYESSGAGGWVARNGRRSGASGSYWLDAMYWRNSKGEITFPLESGGWSNGSAKRGTGVSTKGTRFGYGLTLPLRYWQSVATDRRVIPSGSAVYLSAFRNKPGGGYMCAQDTGGAIIGNHIDVWRPAPSTPDGGESYSNQTVRVITPPQARVILPFCR